MAHFIIYFITSHPAQGVVYAIYPLVRARKYGVKIFCKRSAFSLPYNRFAILQ